ncbi:MAG: YerC/YecD family TrpR-related protein [Candidatus Peribacteraceae bacterium]|nr:DNA-binding transcriptional regulator [bacterium]MDP6561989.1 YerC/YecD family TrpR-related protein [Candidatus Peribacteraceae bacterium]|tara:strand:- start:406 stop:792 length:387 start_codon:yes stop_codon:yes gene_type:complete
MGKRRFTELGWRKDPWFRALCAAIASCKTEEEIGDFLRDLGSLSELQSWSERLEVAKLLSQGLTYRDVAKHTGASTTTVTRVAKSIENGTGAYRKYLIGLQKKEAIKKFETPEEVKPGKGGEALRKYL